MEKRITFPCWHVATDVDSVNLNIISTACCIANIIELSKYSKAERNEVAQIKH